MRLVAHTCPQKICKSQSKCVFSGWKGSTIREQVFAWRIAHQRWFAPRTSPQPSHTSWITLAITYLAISKIVALGAPFCRTRLTVCLDWICVSHDTRVLVPEYFPLATAEPTGHTNFSAQRGLPPSRFAHRALFRYLATRATRQERWYCRRRRRTECCRRFARRPDQTPTPPQDRSGTGRQTDLSA